MGLHPQQHDVGYISECWVKIAMISSEEVGNYRTMLLGIHHPKIATVGTKCSWTWVRPTLTLALWKHMCHAWTGYNLLQKPHSYLEAKEHSSHELPQRVIYVIIQHRLMLNRLGLKNTPRST